MRCKWPAVQRLEVTRHARTTDNRSKEQRLPPPTGKVENGMVLE
jgi:hypothetical protein